MNVISPSIPMKSEPNLKSGLETECLFGESLSILDKHLDWYYCKLLTDNYCGWVSKNGLGEIILPTHRVIANRTFLFKDNNVKSGYINYLPLGSKIHVEDLDKEWAKVCLSDNENDKFGFISSNHIVKNSKKNSDWVGVAEKLIGTPYVWGGRNSIGLDCSALLQLSYQTYGENIPRNSIDQSQLKKKLIKNNATLQRGFVVFWKGHVGIMADEFHCIHANAFYMEVTKEPLVNIVNRTGKNNPVIRIMDFN